jgi:hypothetical protein
MTSELSGVLPYPAQLSLTAPLRLSAGPAREFQPMWSGQGAALAAELPAGELVEALAGDAEGILGRLGS